MREPQFIPSWYPLIRRRKTTLVVQAWATAAAVLSLGVYAGVNRTRTYLTDRNISRCEAAIKRADGELARLGDKLRDQDRLSRQESMVDRLGTSVETTRVLSAIADVLPEQATLTGLSVETVDVARAPTGKKDKPGTDRRLVVTLDGLSPTGVQAAELVERLNRLHVFKDVNLAYMRDSAKVPGGRTGMEFELTFAVDLSATDQGGRLADVGR